MQDKNISIHAQIDRAENIESHLKWAAVKHYAKEHYTEYIVSIIALILCVGAGVYFSSYAIVTLIESNEIQWFYFVGAAIILLFVYFAEYSNISQIARRIKINKNNKEDSLPIGAFRWSVAIALSCFNIALVLIGTLQHTKQTDMSEKLIINSFSKDSLKIVSDFDLQIKEYNSKIDAVRNQFSWKGKIGREGQNLITKYDSKIFDLRVQKVAAIDTLQKSKLSAVIEKKAEIKAFQWWKLAVSLIIEFIILGCSFSIGNYRAGILVYEDELNKRFPKQNEDSKNSEKLITDSFPAKNGQNYSEPKTDDSEKKKQLPF